MHCYYYFFKSLNIDRLNSEKLNFFRSTNRLFESVSDAESHDIKSLTVFPGNLILEVSMKISNCVGSSNMRRWFPMKVSLIAINDYPVQKDSEYNCASFHICEKMVASSAPTETPTGKLKNEFWVEIPRESIQIP